MSEDSHICQIHNKCEWNELIECTNPAWPGDPDGFCILHSKDKEKNQDDFKAALQARWNQADQESYDFRGVFFPGPFDPEEVFGSREFNQPVNFSGATFTEEANFSCATFRERADLIGTTFRELADFSTATFREWANFTGATFTKLADFSHATFTERAYFSAGAIRGQVLFWEINPSEGSESPPPPLEADFGYLRFLDKGQLRFQDVSLAHCTFSGTDLRRPEFHHVTWDSLGGRQIIYDDVKLREEEKEDPWFWGWFRSQVLPWLARYAPYEPPPETPWGDRYGRVERLYRYLKINYETEQDYKNAGDFHYGEMEMHRRASKWRWFPFYWYNIYKVLSGFGERPSWALGWLAVFLLCLGGLVWGLGLEVDKPSPLHIAGFGEAFNYLFQKATFQRPTWAAPAGFGAQLVAGLSALIIPGQAALFLLALRNRLGRRR